MAREAVAMAEEGRSRLGRGLAALIGDVGDESAAVERTRSQRRVPIEFLKPNPRNPRRHFAEAELEELCASIKERGIIQPILVRTARGAVDQYEIIAGERRWRAAQRAGLHDVPIVLLEVSDREALELAIIENVQRIDLNALEEAHGYQALADEFKYSQDDIAKIVGKSRSHVTNTVRLLRLPEGVQEFIRAGKISAGHARALLGQPDPETLAQAIVAQGLSVRQAEAVAQERAAKAGKAPVRRARGAKDADTLALEKRLSDTLGLVVTVAHRGEGGELKIRYKSLDQLDEVIRRIEQTA
jgi:ParB family transcriptional regulator, chromosome partitioning protein